MREKKWHDCPACGVKNSMHVKRKLSEKFELPGYPAVKISGLDGQFCSSCGEGFWSLKSERMITRLLGEHMAEHDATRIVAAELASVQEAAKALNITVQGVHKRMNEGRLRYVVAGATRLPIRKHLPRKTSAYSR